MYLIFPSFPLCGAFCRCFCSAVLSPANILSVACFYIFLPLTLTDHQPGLFHERGVYSIQLSSDLLNFFLDINTFSLLFGAIQIKKESLQAYEEGRHLRPVTSKQDALPLVYTAGFTPNWGQTPRINVCWAAGTQSFIYVISETPWNWDSFLYFYRELLTNGAWKLQDIYSALWALEKFGHFLANQFETLRLPVAAQQCEKEKVSCSAEELLSLSSHLKASSNMLSPQHTHFPLPLSSLLLSVTSIQHGRLRQSESVPPARMTGGVETV